MNEQAKKTVYNRTLCQELWNTIGWKKRGSQTGNTLVLRAQVHTAASHNISTMQHNVHKVWYGIKLTFLWF